MACGTGGSSDGSAKAPDGTSDCGSDCPGDGSKDGGDTPATPPVRPSNAGPPGSLDATFGSAGTATLGVDGIASGAGVQSTGKIIVGGATRKPSASFVVTRLASDGTLDSSFGKAGQASVTIDANADNARTMAIQSDDKILLAGQSGAEGVILRFGVDGSPDGGFGSSGKVLADGASIFALAVDKDGKIVAGGTSSTSVWLARYTQAGAVDGSFHVETGTPDFNRLVTGLAVQPDGKVIATTYVMDGSNVGGDVRRYDTSGSLDTSFGDGGRTGLDPKVGAITPLVAADGKIVVVGLGRIGPGSSPPPSFAITRVDTNGAVDTTFGDQGVTTTAFSGYIDSPFGAVLDADGKPVAAGVSTTNKETSGVALSRYDADGKLDPSFGTGGKSTAGSFFPSAVGRGGPFSLLVAGSNFVVARYWL